VVEAAVRRAVVAILLVATACKTGRNYPEPASPRYAGGAPAMSAAAHGDTIRVVSYNVEFSKEVPRAIQALRTTRELRDADIVLLQEMTAPAAKAIADSLRMSYVYYPAIYNRIYKRDVGNAVLSRWPIVADAKVILPARSRYAKTQRIATAATVRIAGRDLRVYSTHLGTPADLGHEGRTEQLDAIVADAATYAAAIIGGDMNSHDIGEVAVQRGYRWPTRSIPKSNAFGRLDHLFLRGLTETGAGTARTAPNISDHRPIWLTAKLN
jgi:endonuclease/exonuclease/phosphatase family metal-dependent hydrolase